MLLREPGKSYEVLKSRGHGFRFRIEIKTYRILTNTWFLILNSYFSRNELPWSDDSISVVKEIRFCNGTQRIYSCHNSSTQPQPVPKFSVKVGAHLFKFIFTKKNVFVETRVADTLTHSWNEILRPKHQRLCQNHVISFVFVNVTSHV